MLPTKFRFGLFHAGIARVLLIHRGNRRGDLIVIAKSLSIARVFYDGGTAGSFRKYNTVRCFPWLTEWTRVSCAQGARSKLFLCVKQCVRRSFESVSRI